MLYSVEKLCNVWVRVVLDYVVTCYSTKNFTYEQDVLQRAGISNVIQFCTDSLLDIAESIVPNPKDQKMVKMRLTEIYSFVSSLLFEISREDFDNFTLKRHISEKLEAELDSMERDPAAWFLNLLHFKDIPNFRNEIISRLKFIKESPIRGSFLHEKKRDEISKVFFCSYNEENSKIRILLLSWSVNE